MTLKTIFLCAALLMTSSAKASSIYEYLEDQTQDVSPISQRAMLKMLLIGVESLNPSERASLDIVPKGEDLVEVHPDHDERSLFKFTDAKPGGAITPKLLQDYRRNATLRGLLLAAVQKQDSAGTWQLPNARFVHSLLLESAQRSPERLNGISFGLSDYFLRNVFKGKPFALSLYYLVISQPAASPEFWREGTSAYGRPDRDKVAGLQVVMDGSNELVSEEIIYDALITTLAGSLKYGVPGMLDQNKEIDAFIRGPKFVQLAALINRLYQSRLFLSSLGVENARGDLSGDLNTLFKDFLVQARALNSGGLTHKAKIPFVRRLSTLGQEIFKAITNSEYFDEEILRTSDRADLETLPLDCENELRAQPKENL